MRIIFFLLVCGLLVSSYQTTSKAEVALKPGMKFQNFIRPGETPMQVALPEGEWEIAAVREFKSSGNTKLVRVCLFQSSDTKLSKYIRFTTSVEKSFNGGWDSTRACSRDDLHYINVKNNENQEDQDCRYVNHVVPHWLDSSTKFGRECAKIISKQKVEFPNHSIQSYFRFTDDDNVLNVKYYFFPNVEEFENYPKTEWRQSPWNKTNVSIDPKKTAYVGKIIQWNDMFYSTVKTGFNGKLTGASVQNPTPPVVKSPSVSPSVAERLKKLSALFNQELITKQEYEDKRKEILNSM